MNIDQEMASKYKGQWSIMITKTDFGIGGCQYQPGTLTNFTYKDYRIRICQTSK
jgi:hypothetical protein